MSMKKFFVTLILICFSLSCFVIFPACTSTVELLYEGIEADGEVIVYSVVGVKNEKSEFDILIPSTYNDKPVQNIRKNAFQNSLLTRIFIPDSVTLIEENAFLGCNSLINITVDDNNPIYKSINGNLYSKDGYLRLIQYAIGKDDTEVAVPDEVSVIHDNAFCGASTLKSIILPDGVWAIGSYAFANCESLETITIGMIKTDLGIDPFAFAGCNNLKDVYFNGSQKEWDKIFINDGNTCLIEATIHFAE